MAATTSPGLVLDAAAAHARLDRVEKRLRESDQEGLRVAAVDAGLGAIANGHRELAQLVVKQHAATTRTLERLQALLLGVIAEAGLRINDVTPATSGLVGLAVIVFAAGSPDVARRFLDRFARSKGIEPEK